MRKSRKRKLFALVLFISAMIIIIAVLFLLKRNLIEGSYNLYIIADNVNGLEQKNEVNIKGMKVGEVRNVSFLSDSSANIIISLKINKEIRIPVGSYARIMTNEKSTSKFIDIVAVSNDKIYDANDTLKLIEENEFSEEDQLLPLKKKTEEMLESIDTLVQITEMLAGYSKEIEVGNEHGKQSSVNELSDVVYYRVQIMTSIDDISLDDELFDGLKDVWKYFHEGSYKYTVGKTTEYEKAIALKGRLLESGHKGAFIVAFKNGTRITRAKK